MIHLNTLDKYLSNFSIVCPKKSVDNFDNDFSNLLNSEPWLGGLGSLHDLVAGLPLVGLGGLLVVFVSLAHHQNVVTAAERVGVDLYMREANKLIISGY